MCGNRADTLGDRREGLLGDRQAPLRPRARLRLQHYTCHLRQQPPASIINSEQKGLSTALYYSLAHAARSLTPLYYH